MSGKEQASKRQLSLTDMFAKKQKTDSPATEEFNTQHMQTKSSAMTSVSTDNHKQHTTSSAAEVLQTQLEEQPNKYHRLDIGNYIGEHNIPESVKFELLMNCWKPGKTYKFPAETQGGKRR